MSFPSFLTNVHGRNKDKFSLATVPGAQRALLKYVHMHDTLDDVLERGEEKRA